MLTRQYVLELFTIYIGSTFIITGISGNLINTGVFYKHNIHNPSVLLLFVASVFNIIHIAIGLISRILIITSKNDITSSYIIWCKSRFAILQVCALTSLSCNCYAIIDQYFITSQYEKLRRLSKISTTRKVVWILIFFWILFSIPVVIFTSLNRPENGSVDCSFTSNPDFLRFASYFDLLIVWGIAPILILVTFGILTYRNIKFIKNCRHRDRAHHYLTSMILLHIICIVIGTLPYATYYMYYAITLNTTKSANHREWESFFSNIVAVIIYFPNSSSFFIYYLASRTYRRQVNGLLNRRTNRAESSNTPALLTTRMNCN